MKSFKRQFGILTPVFSLASGTLDSAFEYIEFLSDVGAGIWQVLPLGPTHADGSPYLALSSSAGNTQLIGLKMLQAEIGEPIDSLQSAWLIAGQEQYASADCQKFQSDQSSWLPDFALFMVLRRQFEEAPWYQWPESYRKRDLKTLEAARERHREEIQFEVWQQFQFFSQWAGVQSHCREKGIDLFGDVPIYVSHDSVDTWQHQDVFLLNKDGTASAVAGVPPDYFSPQGQLWGNPLYDWDYLAAHDYDWWIDRMLAQAQLFDILRIDHFRGLESYWSVPAGAPTAETGEWKSGPGYEFLDKLCASLGEMRLVAEDLGTITREVDDLRRAFHLPGIRVLQFGFDGVPDNPHAPENIEENSVLCTGTHDNDTTMGWYQGLESWQQQILHSKIDHFCSFPDSLIECAFASPAHTVIIPIMDLLKLGPEGRINTPGTTTGNWVWRMSGLPGLETSNLLRELKQRYDR